MAANESVWSTNTFVLRRAPDQPTDFAKLRWMAVPGEVPSDPCSLTDPNADQYPAWGSATAYEQGQRISYDGLVWEAKWWNRNSSPQSANSAWELISDVELPWVAGLVYEAGVEVNHNGRRWRARWWTQTEEPGTGSAWEDIGLDSCGDDDFDFDYDGPDLTECDLTDPVAGSYPTWSPNETYEGGARINHQGLVWEALWWNTGQGPDSPYAPWILISDVEYPWSSSLIYNTDDEVNHNGQRWRAKWWVQGGEPGHSAAWLRIGDSSCP